MNATVRPSLLPIGVNHTRRSGEVLGRATDHRSAGRTTPVEWPTARRHAHATA